jgi:pimeloyl-ACP methyl ester carboxylesterase
MHLVLVHGAGGTPSTWLKIVPILQTAGFDVTPVTNPMESLRGDIVNTTAAVDATDGPVLLVGHSYGGAVITGAGNHERIAGLVYLAAFGPDEGETVNGIVERYDPAPISAHMTRGPAGEWKSDHGGDFWDDIGWDLDPALRPRWDAEARPSADLIYTQATRQPAWRQVPSWYVVAADDRTLVPEAQRGMAARMKAQTYEFPGSHFLPLVHPGPAAAVVCEAARAAGGGA